MIKTVQVEVPHRLLENAVDILCMLPGYMENSRSVNKRKILAGLAEGKADAFKLLDRAVSVYFMPPMVVDGDDVIT